MALIRYNDGDHPSGFIGIRIAALGVDKKYRQKYFSFRTTRNKNHFVSHDEEVRLTAEAIRLEQQWKQENQELKNLVYKHVYFCFHKNKNYSPKLRIFFQQKNNKKESVSVALQIQDNKLFVEQWNNLIAKIQTKTPLSTEKIKKIQLAIPSFNDLNKKRLIFNKTTDKKYTKSRLRSLFD